MKKLLIVFIGFLSSVVAVYPETKGTSISYFIFQANDLKNKTKTFINKVDSSNKCNTSNFLR